MKKIILFLTGILVSLQLWAESENSKMDSTVYLKQVVISATKAQVNRNSVPVSISVLERDEIEAGGESALLPVLSERIPGLFVTEKGVTGFGVSSGSAGTVNIRGVGEGNKVLMLFDGQPQWAGIFGHSLPDTYVASDVDRVEVIRGPGSLLYGSNAMGGVVNIITRRHHQPGRQTQARVMYGSYNTQKYMVNNGYNAGNFSSFVSINHDRTDGHRNDSEFHITNGYLNLGYRFGDHYKVTGNASLAKSFGQNPGEITQPILDNVMDVLRGTGSLALENNYENVSGAIRAFYNWGNHEINDGYYAGDAARDFLFRSDDHNYGVLLYETFRLFEGNHFTLGLDYKNWGGHAWNANNDGSKKELIDKSIDETAAYLIMQQDLFDRLSLNAGARYEYNSAFGGVWIPQAGLTVRPFSGNTVKASLSKGFRSPNIREMYMFPPQNPDLKPENMLNYEASVGQTFLDDRLTVELTAFFIDGKEMIQTLVFDGKPRNVNTGKFINKGIELEAGVRILDNLHFDMNYSYLHTDKPLVAAPKHKLFANLTYRPGRFTFDVNTQSVAGLYINTKKEIKEDYTTLNVRVSYLFGTRERGLSPFLKGENLTATNYTINEGFPMPKAVVFGGFNILF
ncbi:MAG: TonB-dependent receptor [Dysgonamonadaceae bacterium]|jgi:iron complex outermembrane receptor protein|nr:TonB-dependent receptor [Dysgonamonadaceae bacterium]